MKKPLSRRAFIGGGAAVAISLPFLDAMVPTGRKARAQAERPSRLVHLYVPHGIIRTNFTPTSAGPDYAMPSQLAALAPLRDKFSVLTGLSNHPGSGRYTYADGTEENDGPGDHARDTGTFLTATRIRKTDGSDHRAGISVDQVAANHLAPHTALPSLVLATKSGSYGGDSGYAPIYRSNVSWANPTQPMAKDSNASSVFNTLFAGFDPGEGEAARARRLAQETSILDSCLEDLASLRVQLGAADNVKLDGYLEGIRRVESSIMELPGGVECNPGASPEGGLNFQENTVAMLDLIKLAFQCDRTRVASLMIESNGYGFIGVGDGHHQISHLENLDPHRAGIETINKWGIDRFAEFLTALDSIDEDEDGTLLDNSLVMYGGGLDATGHAGGNAMGDLTPRQSGGVHRHTNLPILLGGTGRGQVRTGEHFVVDGDPIANLYLSMLESVGAPDETFGLEGTETLAAIRT